MNFNLPMTFRHATILFAGYLFMISSNAQNAVAPLGSELVAVQKARVKVALEKLSQFQLVGCWKNATLSPLIGISNGEGGVIKVNFVPLNAVEPVSLVKPGDTLVAVDGEMVAAKGGSGVGTASKMRSKSLENLRASGRTFVESYRNALGQEIPIPNPVEFRCRVGDIHVVDRDSDSAGRRILEVGLFISSARLALLDDDQLLAFVAWNQAFTGLRHESNAGALGALTLIGNGRASVFIYNGSTHEKIDWVTLSSLRAINANMNAYKTMLSVVDAFDKAAGFTLLGDNKFIGSESGASPFGGEEKQTRLTQWINLLEEDAAAPMPASLKFSNTMLSRFTWTNNTMPLSKYQTVFESLQAILGDAKAKDVADRYLASFEQVSSTNTVAGHLGKQQPSKVERMLFAHHRSKRLIWAERAQSTDFDICVKANECSVIAIGLHAVARPSAIWAQELSASPDSYKLEEWR